MANSLDAFVDKLLAQGVLALRQNCVITRLVNSAYRAQTGTRGSVIEIPIPSALVVNTVTPSVAPAATQDMVPTTALVPMNQWKEVPFTFTDQEIHQVSAGVFPSQASEAIKALIAGIASYIYGMYKETYNFVGDPAVIAFDGSQGTEPARAMRKKLTQELAPATDRFAIISPDVTEKMTGVDAFALVNESGTDAVMREGMPGRKFGFDWSEDQLMPIHATGTVGGTGVDTVVNGIHAIGVSIVNVTVGATNALDLKIGDIVDFAVAGEYYTLTADVSAAAAGAAALAIKPPLRTATADLDIVLCLGDDADYEVNIGAHRDAFAFASVEASEMDLNKLLGAESSVAAGANGVDRQITDPITNIALRLVIAKQHYQWRLAFSMLYGASIPRPELATRLVSLPV